MRLGLHSQRCPRVPLRSRDEQQLWLRWAKCNADRQPVHRIAGGQLILLPSPQKQFPYNLGMNILAELQRRFGDALTGLVADPTEHVAMIRPSQDPKFGDYQ